MMTNLFILFLFRAGFFKNNYLCAMQDIGQLKRILQMTLGPTQESINQGEALLNQQSRVPR
jgi:hypothetical protein